MKTLAAQSVAEWRDWLTKHHDRELEIWLVFNKRHTGRPSIAYSDALDEALCFGWVDSLVKRLDENRYARKFTPRREHSAWSDVNRERYEALAAAGRLTPAGKQRPPTDRRAIAPAKKVGSTLPQYIGQALARSPAALRNFEQLPPSHRRNYIGWIESAKKEETRLKRLNEAIRMLAAGQRLGLK